MDIFELGITSVASITMICFLVCQGLKAAGLNTKWIPVLCGIMGGMLGVAGMFLMPGFPAQDIITAIAVGVASGLATTGAHQIGKQAGK